MKKNHLSFKSDMEKSTFDQYDLDNDGQLSRDEYRQFMKNEKLHERDAMKHSDFEDEKSKSDLSRLTVKYHCISSTILTSICYAILFTNLALVYCKLSNVTRSRSSLIHNLDKLICNNFSF